MKVKYPESPGIFTFYGLVRRCRGVRAAMVKKNNVKYFHSALCCGIIFV